MDQTLVRKQEIISDSVEKKISGVPKRLSQVVIWFKIFSNDIEDVHKRC